MSYLVEQLPHCDLLRLSLSTGWFVLSARQVVTVWKDFLVFSVPGASFLDTRHYGCVSHWLTELTLSQNFANPLCLFTRRCRAPGCDGFLILRKFFQNPPCLFTRRCRPGGRAGDCDGFLILRNFLQNLLCLFTRRFVRAPGQMENCETRKLLIIINNNY